MSFNGDGGLSAKSSFSSDVPDSSKTDFFIPSEALEATSTAIKMVPLLIPKSSSPSGITVSTRVVNEALQTPKNQNIQAAFQTLRGRSENAWISVSRKQGALANDSFIPLQEGSNPGVYDCALEDLPSSPAPKLRAKFIKSSFNTGARSPRKEFEDINAPGYICKQPELTLKEIWDSFQGSEQPSDDDLSFDDFAASAVYTSDDEYDDWIDYVVEPDPNDTTYWNESTIVKIDLDSLKIFPLETSPAKSLPEPFISKMDSNFGLDTQEMLKINGTSATVPLPTFTKSESSNSIQSGSDIGSTIQLNASTPDIKVTMLPDYESSPAKPITRSGSWNHATKPTRATNLK